MHSFYRWFKHEIKTLWHINRWQVIGVSIAFIIGVIAGYTLSTEAKLVLIESVGVKFEAILEDAGSPLQLAINIFLNNTIVAVLSFALGFTFFLPVIVVFSNGLIVGVFVYLLQRADAVTPGTFIGGLTSLIPHGIFELPALFLAGALSMTIVQKIVMPHSILPHMKRRTMLWQNTLRFVGWVIGLLIIAALVESMVSGVVSKKAQEFVRKDTTNDLLLVNLDSKFLLSNNCVPSPAIEASEEALTGRSLANVAKVVFKDDLYSRFQYRSTLPQWSEFYLCNNGLFITVETWHNTQWSLAEAATLTWQMYDELDYQYQYVNNRDGIDIFIKNQESPFAVYFRTVDGKTTIITVSDPKLDIDTVLTNFES